MRKIKKGVLLSPLLTSFLKDCLINERGLSPDTVASYSYTFHLLLQYSKKVLKKESFEITLVDLSSNFLRNFLLYLENDRHNKPQSRNQRLAAIRSFFKYISAKIPEMSAEIGQVLAIQEKKEKPNIVHFLTPQEVKAILI